MDLTSIGTIVGSVFGSQALTTWIQVRYGQKKTDAEAATTLVQTILQWQQTLTERIAHLEEQLKDKDIIIDNLRDRIIKLENNCTCKL